MEVWSLKKMPMPSSIVRVRNYVLHSIEFSSMTDPF